MPTKQQQEGIQKRLWGSYKPTEKDMESVSWCLNNGIEVSLLGVKGDAYKYKVEVAFVNRNERKRNINPKLFDIGDAVEVLYNYYNFYYNKHKNNKHEK